MPKPAPGQGRPRICRRGRTWVGERGGLGGKVAGGLPAAAGGVDFRAVVEGFGE
jgi:hypothetical protein